MFLWIPKIDRVIRVYYVFIDAPCIQAILNILGTLPSCFSSARRIYSSKQYNGDENFAVNCFWRLTERSRAFDRLCLSLSVQPLCWSADALPSSWPNEFQMYLILSAVIRQILFFSFSCLFRSADDFQHFVNTSGTTNESHFSWKFLKNFANLIQIFVWKVPQNCSLPRNR